MRIHLFFTVLIGLSLTSISRAIVVTNASDTGAGSLRAALASTDVNVTFDAAFFATPRTITLASGLSLTRDKTITGPGAANLTIDGGNLYRILAISLPSVGPTLIEVEISGLTFTRGRTTAGGGAAIQEGNNTILSLSDCVFTNNQNTGIGGDSGGAVAFFNSASTTAARFVRRCTFTNNTSTSNGGAVVIDIGASRPQNYVVFVDCSFSGNAATGAGRGGAIYQFTGNSKIQKSTLDGNSAAQGGACYLNAGGMSFWSSTLSGNSARVLGTAILSEGNLNLNASTITGNSVATPGSTGIAVYLGNFSGLGSVGIASTIIAGNFQGSFSDDVGGPGTITSQSSNLIGNASGITNGANGTKVIGNASPLLAPLALYGGTTRTQPPLPSSPAEFLGLALTDGSTPWTQDQRGVNYVGNASTGRSCGAVQQRPFTLAVVSGGGQSTLINTNFANPVVVSVTGTSGDPANGGKIRLRPVPSASASITQTADFDSTMIATGQVSISGLTANATPGAHILRVILPANLDIQLTNLGIPDISVSGNGVAIPDGDTTPAAADHTDFGAVAAAGSATLNRTFTITNTGNGTLSLPASFATVVSRGATPFTISGILLSQGILPGGSSSFAVIFDPSAAGVFTATVEISSNDPDENPYNFTVSAQAVSAGPTDISLSVTSIPENSGTTVGSLTRTGGEAGTPVYTLVAGSGSTDNALCAISGTSLLLNAAADFEAKSSYAVRLRVTEPSGASIEKALSFTITNVNEAPTWTAGPPPQTSPSLLLQQTIANWATAISDGDATVVQGLAFTSTVLTGANLFHTAPSLDTAGTLNFRPNLNGLTGTATVRFTLTDDATISGGAALTNAQVITFSIGVTPLPSVPVVISNFSFTPLASPGVGATVVISASGPASLGSRLWVLKASNDLQTWTSAIAQQTASATGTATFSLNDTGATGARRFYRVEVP